MKNTLIYDTKERYMRLYIKPPRRPKHLVLESMFKALGGCHEVAALCFVQPVSPSKWQEDPFESGQDIPVKHLQALLATAGENLTNFPLQNAVDELLQDHFLNLCHRRAILEDKVFEIVEALTGNGKAVQK